MSTRAEHGRSALATVTLGWALLALGAAATCPRAAQAQAVADRAPDRAVVEQKVALLGRMLDAPRTAQILAAGDPEIAALVAQARNDFAQARDALAAGETSRAGMLLDQALKAFGAASTRGTRGTAADGAQRNRNREVLDELSSYRASLEEAIRAKGEQTDAAQLQRIDRLTAQADELTRAGRHADAGKALAQAYAVAVATLTRLRAGQTVTMSLTFDSPADEYAYEQRRHRSNEMLIQMLLAEGKVEGGRRVLMDRYLADSLTLRSQAENVAGGGDYPGAIRIMEKANDQLMNAIRASGLASF